MWLLVFQVVPASFSDQHVCILQEYRELRAIDLQAEVPHIPSDLRMYWYSAERGVCCCCLVVIHTLMMYSP